MARALYIHWPFCLKKCPYCDFNSHVRDAVDHARWQAALIADMRALINEQLAPEQKAKYQKARARQQLIKRMGISGRTLSEEEMEDAGLALAMSKVDRTKVVSKERVLRKLRA